MSNEHHFCQMSLVSVSIKSKNIAILNTCFVFQNHEAIVIKAMWCVVVQWLAPYSRRVVCSNPHRVLGQDP